jgi:hypothetical protein
MLKFTFKDKVTVTVRASCPKHRRYNPEANGHGGIVGGCSTCQQLFEVWTAKNRVESAIRDFRVLAETLNKPRRATSPSELTASSSQTNRYSREFDRLRAGTKGVLEPTSKNFGPPPFFPQVDVPPRLRMRAQSP